MNVTTSTRNMVYERDSFQCIHCGTMKGLVLRQRSHTGNGGAENLITICKPHSGLLDSNVHFAELAMNHGYKLRSWEEPENREVYYQADGEWFYLTERGTRIRAGESDED